MNLLFTIGSFFFKWANFGPGRFYHWWVKVRKQKECFTHLPHMYMIFTLKSIRNRTNLIQKFIWQYSLCFGIKIDLINDLTTNFSLSRWLNIVDIALLLWLWFDLAALQPFRLSIPSKPKQKIKFSHIVRPQKVRG